MCVSQSQRSLGAGAAPRRHYAAVAEFGDAGVEREQRAGIGPETPGGLSVDQPGPACPCPLVGRVSDVTASQDNDPILCYQTQSLGGECDEERSCGELTSTQRSS